MFRPICAWTSGLLLGLVAVTPALSAKTLTLCMIGDSGVKPKEDNEHFEEHVENQKRVVERLAQERCDRLYILGDIIYNDGITDPDDSEYERQFSGPYAPALDGGAEAYLVLGNHDYMLNPAAFTGVSAKQLSAARFPYPQSSFGYELQPRGTSRYAHPNVHFPGPFFEEWDVAGDADDGLGLCIAGIDSSPFFPTQMKLQRVFSSKKRGNVRFDFDHFEDMRDVQDHWMKNFNRVARDCKVKIAVAHHPYKSVGGHGDAGSGLGFGKKYVKFVERHIVGKFDYLISGHDHSLSYEGQDRCLPKKCSKDCRDCARKGKDCDDCQECLAEKCGVEGNRRITHLLVSGGGAYLKDLKKKNAKTMCKKIKRGADLFGAKRLGYAVVHYDPVTGDHSFVVRYRDGGQWHDWAVDGPGGRVLDRCGG